MESPSDRPVDWTLLTRYVSGDCSEDEEVVVETWAAADPKNRRLIRELRGIWETMSQWQSRLPVDVDAAWGELDQRIREAEEGPPPERSPLGDDRSGRPPRTEASRSQTSRRTLYARAAVVGVVVAVALGFFAVEGLSHGDKESAKKKVYTTERGQRAVVQLTDGTDVRLNVDSRLVLPDGGFAGNRREVRLEGEAYFDIARDTTRPFEVHVRDASVRALGTAFGVEAYPDDAEARVAVTEGTVALRSGRSEAQARVLLRSRDLGVASGTEGWSVHRGADLSREFAWTDGQLDFRDAPFDEVLRKLRRWYDLQIESQVASEEVGRLNATLDGESPENTLRAIAAALNLRYERTGDTVVYFRGDRRPARRER